MKKRINLLHSTKNYRQYETIFRYIRLASIIYGVIFLVGLSISFVLLFRKNQEYESLNSRRSSDVAFLLSHKEKEAEFVLFGNKLSEAKDLLKEDVNFHPYYKLLSNSLRSASQEAKFESISIDKDKSVEFTVSLSNYQHLLSFFRFAESEDFLKNFKELTLTNFDVTDAKKSYKIAFKGKFIDLNEYTK